MRRKTYLPPSPLAPRQLVSFDLADPKQHRATAKYLRERLGALARDKAKFPNEFDRLIADTETWCHDVVAEAGLRPDEAVPDDRYPEAIWYAIEIKKRVAEIRDLRDSYPDLAVSLALLLGQLIGEARAHLRHGQDAARGIKAVQSAREGHEQVHGTEAKKTARWSAQFTAFKNYRAQGLNITESERRAATECGVSPRTIFEARKRAQIT